MVHSHNDDQSTVTKGARSSWIGGGDGALPLRFVALAFNNIGGPSLLLSRDKKSRCAGRVLGCPEDEIELLSTLVDICRSWKVRDGMTSRWKSGDGKICRSRRDVEALVPSRSLVQRRVGLVWRRHECVKVLAKEDPVDGDDRRTMTRSELRYETSPSFSSLFNFKY